MIDLIAATPAEPDAVPHLKAQGREIVNDRDESGRFRATRHVNELGS